ncbi:HEAT repeat-containing protein-like protein 1, partial [Blyttiomyces helicus]
MPAPATTLAQQLQRVAATVGSSVNAAVTKKASLLFSAKEAADVDKETLFAVARNGLLDLTSRDPAFAQWEATLFSEASKTLDRALQSKEDNAKLDESIAKFLRTLSPHFLLQSALKVMEWLVRRFRAHELNVDSLVECVLPYHETKQFALVVSILVI